MAILLIPMPGNDSFADALSRSLPSDRGELETRHFPDGESYIRFVTDPNGRSVALLCTLAKPNDKILDLLFAASTARELGAAKVGLIAPYLAYMRQDRRFKPGEAVTSREVARLLSNAFDWLVTVDPHLHRYASLAEIYTIPAQVVHAAPLISQWIRANAPSPLIIGPDGESEQWVSEVAKDARAPYTVLQKVRHGDRDIEISIRNPNDLGTRTPVFVDDIISTGRTMIKAVRLVAAHATAPVCVAVHGLFADNSDTLLTNAGARVVTTNSVPHATNAIDVSSLLTEAIRRLMIA